MIESDVSLWKLMDNISHFNSVLPGKHVSSKFVNIAWVENERDIKSSISFASPLLIVIRNISRE